MQKLCCVFFQSESMTDNMYVRKRLGRCVMVIVCSLGVDCCPGGTRAPLKPKLKIDFFPYILLVTFSSGNQDDGTGIEERFAYDPLALCNGSRWEFRHVPKH